MSNQNKRQSKRIRNLVAICFIIAIVLSVSTYAWFIGMRTVNVSSFDVEIASTDSLMLSLDGSHWSTTVNISSDTYNDDTTTDGDPAVVYTGNTNNWAGRGLLPMSSIGEMDSTFSRMKLFEKASLTATRGGYRLMASRVKNYDGDPERDGYVVFDLFVHNYSGPQYLANLEPKDEEAIYLTNDSSVRVASTGVANTGIENSVRVAFTQIGRVIGTTNTPETITGITCGTDSNVTGICRNAQIWEPNDTNHVQNALSWYNTSCLKRTGIDVTEEGSYSTTVGSCEQVIDGKSYPTYAVSADIASADNVDIYDGPAYNTYVPIDPDGEGPLTAKELLKPYAYFTDTMKLLTGTKRPQFMTLEPNSITKLRIYIYIEGQDVDNYDFASIGKKISVNFGFTKERYTEDDTGYTGPETNEGDGPGAADTMKPVITLTGDNPMTITLGGTYTESNATASDRGTGSVVDLTSDIVITGTVDTSVIGTYYKTYTVKDAAGNVGTKVRTINVVQP